LLPLVVGQLHSPMSLSMPRAPLDSTLGLPIELESIVPRILCQKLESHDPDIIIIVPTHILNHIRHSSFNIP
jgi:hypothetical protein